jgi:hypothetical protein
MRPASGALLAVGVLLGNSGGVVGGTPIGSGPGPGTCSGKWRGNSRWHLRLRGLGWGRGARRSWIGVRRCRLRVVGIDLGIWTLHLMVLPSLVLGRVRKLLVTFPIDGAAKLTGRPRFPAPISSDPCAVPTDHSIRLDDRQRAPNIGEQPIKADQYQSVDAADEKPFFGAVRRRTLTCWRSTRFSASSAPLDRNSPTSAHQVSLQKSHIGQHHPIRSHSPAGRGFR